MAVEQMKYVSILGPIYMFDEFVLKCVINKNIQLEPPYKSINVPGLIPFEEDHSLDPLRKRMSLLNEKFGVAVGQYGKEEIEKKLLAPVDISDMEAFTVQIEDRISEYRNQKNARRAQMEEREQILSQLLPLARLQINIDEMFHFSFMKIRFGYLSKSTYMKQKSYLEGLDVVIAPVTEENEKVWMFYFMPQANAAVMDNVFSAIGFERVRISGEAKGMPKVTIEKLQEEISLLKEEMSREEEMLHQFLRESKEQFDHYYHRILYFSKLNEVKKLAAHNSETFFLAGWIPRSDFKLFQSEVGSLDKIILNCEDPERLTNLEPPTILKNSRLFKPFESLVGMYGIPSPKELDPTPITALTYVLMFGIMFGDAGQGAVIALAGFLLYRFKKSNLGGMMMYVGISSTIFGFVYGSVFGSEKILEPLWISPLHGKDTINTLLYGAVGYGAFIILLTMVLNIVNNIRMRRWGRLLFDKNGLAGLLFYGGIVAVVLNFIRTGKFVMTWPVWIVVIIIPTLMILFKEPLENLILRKGRIFPKAPGMYFVEAFFDLFETVMSFFSGTVSFARVGAFALNHAGLSLAVWTLYNMMEGVGGIIVVIIGNLLTIGLEGLIVAIQCMRLEYYEMFGRFYTGEGREFRPVTITENQ